MVEKPKAIPTTYKGIHFRSRLEATWAAFFDLIRWRWVYEPLDFDGWIPDFYVHFSCEHSECPPDHHLYVEVKPFLSIRQFDDCFRDPYGDRFGLDGVLLLGVTPEVAEVEMVHGSGGGLYTGWDPFRFWAKFSLKQQLDEGDSFLVEAAWNKASNLTRWYPVQKPGKQDVPSNEDPRQGKLWNGPSYDVLYQRALEQPFSFLLPRSNGKSVFFQCPECVTEGQSPNSNAVLRPSGKWWCRQSGSEHTASIAKILLLFN